MQPWGAPAAIPGAMRAKPPFFCTFCMNKFRTDLDRDRHERDVHLDDPRPGDLP